MSPSILVIGSSNTDMVIQSERIPQPGETILGGRFFMNPGGKGANQAVAAARAGGRVVFVAKVGNDIFGEQATQQFAREGMDTTYVSVDAEQPSGVALITVDAAGENSIVVASGANATLGVADVEAAATALQGASVMLLQLEIPLESVVHAAALARRYNVPVVLNPAPARALPDELLAHISILTPNETEAHLLTGIAVHDAVTARKAAQVLHRKGVDTVIITLGSKGAFVSNSKMELLVPAPQVRAVDSTAAGDVFNGTLSVALSEGLPLADAVAFACRAAALSVTRLGAQTSAPGRSEIDAFQGMVEQDRTVAY